MRQLKFRGEKRVNGEWAYGSLLVDGLDDRMVIFECFSPSSVSGRTGFEVDPKTIGQFTGLRDRNGREIYEGDIVAGDRPDFICKVVGTVTHEGGWAYWAIGKTEEGEVWRFTVTNEKVKQLLGLEVIGNMTDNPELLEAALRS